MPNKTHKPEEIVAQLRQGADVLFALASKMPDVVPAIRNHAGSSVAELAPDLLLKAIWVYH